MGAAQMAELILSHPAGELDFRQGALSRKNPQWLPTDSRAARRTPGPLSSFAWVHPLDSGSAYCPPCAGKSDLGHGFFSYVGLFTTVVSMSRDTTRQADGPRSNAVPAFLVTTRDSGLTTAGLRAATISMDLARR